MTVLQGRWFDGRSSQAQLVAVRLVRAASGPALELAPAAGGTPLKLEHAEIGWPERWSARRRPRSVMVDLGAHGSLQVDDVAAWEQALDAAGYAAPIAQRMQTRWRVLAAVLVVAVGALLVFYRWGTPWLATQLTRSVPLAWEQQLAARAMRDLDESFLEPSKLPAERQAQLKAAFDALQRQVTPQLRRYGGYAPPLALHFRSGLGPNAFALPGGTIVMTDAMVQAAAKHGLGDEALLGVLAHEIGHVVHRHTTRMVVEQGVLNVGLGLALGDVSTVVSMGASVLTGLAYRRSHETEADCFALALMAQARLPTAPMGQLLLKVDDAPRGESASWLSLLASHPETPERARALEAGQAPACR